MLLNIEWTEIKAKALGAIARNLRYYSVGKVKGIQIDKMNLKLKKI